MSHFKRFFLFICLLAGGIVHAENLTTERVLAAIQPTRGFRYNAHWKPPGSSGAWAMDCSNTARWIALSAFGIKIPRTASDQYLYFAQKGRLKRAARNAQKLARVLRPGDFLFWKDTYPPKRQPPITHVMVYLGRSAEGAMLMAGSQSSHGVNIYRFHPEKDYGGYRWLFFFRRHGRFVGYGRPG